MTHPSETIKHQIVHSTVTSSESSSRPATPDFTPSETPHERTTDLQELETSVKMEGSTAKESGSTPETPPPAVGTDVKVESTKMSSETPKKPARKKHECRVHGHAKSKSKSKKKVESKDSSSSSSDSSSESESDESDSSSSSSEDREAKKKAKKKAAKKKAKARKKKESSDEDTDSSDDTSSSEEDKRMKKKKLRKAKVKKARKEASELEDQNQDQAALAQQLNQQLALGGNARNMRRAANLNFGTRQVLDQTNSGLGIQSKAGIKQSVGSKPSFFRVDQLYDNAIHNWKLTETAPKQDEQEYGKFVFHVRRKFDWEGKYTETVVDIKSKPLREALKTIMAGCKAVSLEEATPAIDPNILFMYLSEFEKHHKELKFKYRKATEKKVKKALKLKAAHVKVLLKYINKDYAETKQTLYPLLEAGKITFELLWFLYKSNDVAYCPTYGNRDEPRAFRIENATKESSFMRGTWYNIDGRYLEYDGKTFGTGSLNCEVEAFKGPKTITSLGCYPLKYHKDPESVRALLIERGRKFVALKGMNFRFHKGMAFYKKKRQVVKVNINGRVMIDPAGHRRINPNYPVSTVKPDDPDILDEEENSDEDCGCCQDDDDAGASPPEEPLADADQPRVKMKLVVDGRNRPHVVEVEVDEHGNQIQREDIQKAEQEEIGDDDLLISSPVVLGFSFSEKLWLEFTVSGINDIEWNDKAFDSLQIPENQKSIVKALVESHTQRASCNIDDVVQGKGRGLVAVLHGNPGTGKTLTAEGIAELLKCPLYMVSAGELGTNPRELEAELNKILDIAHSWGAILLLDEADVFLEKRTMQDIHRNALVSIFLRLLEYFQGILFLTTNRISDFDPAFQSRIHLALRYGELTFKAKRAVWQTFIGKVKELAGVDIAVFKDADYDRLAKHNLNGRQIKNAVRTAQALAVNEKAKLSMTHIVKVLDVADAFEKDLKGGTGYEDAMRSYT